MMYFLKLIFPVQFPLFPRCTWREPSAFHDLCASLTQAWPLPVTQEALLYLSMKPFLHQITVWKWLYCSSGNIKCSLLPTRSSTGRPESFGAAERGCLVNLSHSWLPIKTSKKQRGRWGSLQVVEHLFWISTLLQMPSWNELTSPSFCLFLPLFFSFSFCWEARGTILMP